MNQFITVILLLLSVCIFPNGTDLVDASTKNEVTEVMQLLNIHNYESKKKVQKHKNLPTYNPHEAFRISYPINQLVLGVSPIHYRKLICVYLI